MIGMAGCAIGFTLARWALEPLAFGPRPASAGRSLLASLAVAFVIGSLWSVLALSGILARSAQRADRAGRAILACRQLALFVAAGFLLFIVSPTALPAVYKGWPAAVIEMGFGLVYELGLPPVFWLERVVPAVALLIGLRSYWRRKWFLRWRFAPLTVVLAILAAVLALTVTTAFQALAILGLGHIVRAGHRQGWWIGVLGFGHFAFLMHVGVFLVGTVFHFGMGTLLSGGCEWVANLLTAFSGAGVLFGVLAGRNAHDRAALAPPRSPGRN